MPYREWLPDRGSRRSSRVAAPLRRAAVRVFTRMTGVPALRPLGEAGMRALFNQVAPRWDRIRAEPVYREAFVAALDALPTRMPQARAPRTMLDVACGTGIATALLAQRFPAARLVGIDISPRMAELAQRAVPGAEIVVGSSVRLPFADGEFGLVTSLDGVFDAGELARVCAPGGVVVVVYSLGGQCPVARPAGEVASELAAAGMQVVVDEGTSWVVYGRRLAGAGEPAAEQG